MLYYVLCKSKESKLLVHTFPISSLSCYFSMKSTASRLMFPCTFPVFNAYSTCVPLIPSSICVFLYNFLHSVTPLLTLAPSQRYILPVQSTPLPSQQWQVFLSQNLYDTFLAPLLLQSRPTCSSISFNPLTPNNFQYSCSHQDGTTP